MLRSVCVCVPNLLLATRQHSTQCTARLFEHFERCKICQIYGKREWYGLYTTKYATHI